MTRKASLLLAVLTVKTTVLITAGQFAGIDEAVAVKSGCVAASLDKSGSISQTRSGPPQIHIVARVGASTIYEDVTRYRNDCSP